MRYSSRSMHNSPSGFRNIHSFELERYFAQYEFDVPYHLSASDCESPSIGEVLELAGVEPEVFLAQRLGYTESRGDPALRTEIAEDYPSCTADDVLITNAPEEAIFLAMHAILRPGDRVVVQTPCYQSLGEIARSIGCDVVEWPLIETESGWQLDLDGLEQRLVQKTRLLVVNAPHNPTGHQPTADERGEIMASAASAGARVFSDEMYRGLALPALELVPAAAVEESAVSLWGMSKTFGMPGLRIGWLVCRDRAFLADVERLKDFTTICSSAPGESLARIAWPQRAVFAARHRVTLAAHDAAARAFADRFPDRFRWLAPMAGPVGLCRLLEGSAQELCARAREEAEVLAVPSTLFALPDRYIRFGLGRLGFGAALTQLEAWIGGRK